MTEKPNLNWETVRDDYPVGALVTGTVVHRAVFGIFLRLPNGGLAEIEAPELSPDKTLNPEDFPEIGTALTGRVLGYRDSNQQVILTPQS